MFRVKGTVPKFAGWMATYGLMPGETEQKDTGPAPGGPGGIDAGDDDEATSGVLPPLAEGDRLELKALRPEQKFTQPPPRFSEATLVKELEENGIGRPSTLRVDHRRPSGSRVRQQDRKGASSRRRSA